MSNYNYDSNLTPEENLNLEIEELFGPVDAGLLRIQEILGYTERNDTHEQR